MPARYLCSAQLPHVKVVLVDANERTSVGETGAPSRRPRVAAVLAALATALTITSAAAATSWYYHDGSPISANANKALCKNSTPWQITLRYVCYAESQWDGSYCA